LCIENNLQVREQIKESSGIGLANIVQRYSLLTKKNVFIEKSEDYFKVKLPVLSSKPDVVSEISETKNESYERAQTGKRNKKLLWKSHFLLHYHSFFNHFKSHHQSGSSVVLLADVRLGNRTCSTRNERFCHWKRLGRKKDQEILEKQNRTFK
jgi:hypothetical protein